MTRKGHHIDDLNVKKVQDIDDSVFIFAIRDTLNQTQLQGVSQWNKSSENKQSTGI